MKKLLNLALSLVLVFALAGCGKEQTATYEISTNVGEMVMTDTLTYSAKGDIVYEMVEKIIMDFSNYNEETKASDMETYGSVYDEMSKSSPDGVTMTCTTDGDIITVDMTIDFKAADLKELVDNGYIYTTSDEEGNLVAISFQQSCTGLEASGYTLKE